MKRIFTLMIGVASLALGQWKAEPLVGEWQMISQTYGTTKVEPVPIAISITQKEADLTFRYLAGAERKQNMAFTVRLDGPESDIKSIDGRKLGTAKLAKSGSKYELTLQRPNAPAEPGTLTLSERNYVLTVETYARLPETGTTRIIQVFAKE